MTLVPESAPFSPEQRAWLNGFFTGLVSLDGAVTALSPEQGAALMAGVAPAPKAPPGDIEDDGAPWHDQGLPMAERMKLAEGRPLQRRLMAAMAQQDCGQCGYNCQDYSNAIFHKQEERLNLCVPGGKDHPHPRRSTRLGKSRPFHAAPAPAAAAKPAAGGKPGYSAIIRSKRRS